MLAKQNIQQALDIFEAKLGKDHPDTQTVKNWLNAVEREVGGK